MGDWPDDDEDDDSSVEQDDDPLGYCNFATKSRCAVENEMSDVEDEATKQPSSKTKGQQGVKYWQKLMSFKS